MHARPPQFYTQSNTLHRITESNLRRVIVSTIYTFQVSTRGSTFGRVLGESSPDYVLASLLAKLSIWIRLSTNRFHLVFGIFIGTFPRGDTFEFETYTHSNSQYVDIYTHSCRLDLRHSDTQFSQNLSYASCHTKPNGRLKTDNSWNSIELNSFDVSHKPCVRNTNNNITAHTVLIHNHRHLFHQTSLSLCATQLEQDSIHNSPYREPNKQLQTTRTTHNNHWGAQHTDDIAYIDINYVSTYL